MNLDLGGFELPKISALYEDGTQIERLAPGVADAFPKLPDKLVDREKHLGEIQSKIDKRSKLLLWSRLPKSTKTILSVQLAKRYSQEQNIIYIKASTSSRMCRQIISHVERIRAETKATVSIPADLSYVFEDVLALLIELLKRYAKHVSIIIDDFNEIDSNELQSSLISLISSWPHLAIIVVDTITDRKRILSLTENVKNIEITGYSINDILQLLQFEKLPSAAHKKEYAEMIYALSSRGYPPLSHHMIRKVREAYSEKGTIGIFTPFLQKTTLPDDAALAVTRALKETLTGLDDKTILAVISLSLGSALPKRCITKALEKTFEIETAGESIQRLSNLWLDEDVKGRLSAPQALKLHSQSWLSESKKREVYKVFAEQLCVFHQAEKDPPLYIEADEWLDGILYSLFAFDGKTAVENLMPLVAYVGRAPTDKIIKQLVNHPLFLLPGKTGNVFTANDAIQWEQAKSMILRTAGRYRDVVESMDNALSIASSVSPEEENKLLKNICLVSRGHAKALLGEMKEAKRDYVQAITGLKSIGEEQKLTQLLDVFISSLLNPQHFTVDILSTIIELIEECGVDYFNREVESLSKDSIRLLPDLIIYRFSNESWNEKTINKSVNRLHSVSKKAHAAGLNEFALICLDGASFLLMNKADKVQRALELYEEALALEQKSVDELTFWYLRARCLVSFADGLYKLKREQEAHSNYIKALKAYNHLRVLDKRNKLGLDKEFLVVHVRRRIAEIDRKFGKLKYSIRHLRKALQIIGLGVRNNSLYYGCILPDLATALAMNGETFQAIKILDLAAFIGVSQSLSLIKTNLCGWAALQMLEYDPNSGHSTLRVSAK